MNDIATATPAERVRLFRSNHRILVEEQEHPSFGRIYRCGVEGLRVQPTRDGRWRHDGDEVMDLLNAEYGGLWGRPAGEERKIAAISRIVDLYNEDYRDDEEPEFDREGAPEFNGSFR